jgi:hypothetical protein
MRGYDHRGLAAGARHVIRVSWHRILTDTVDPKKGALDRALIGHPSWCRCADELRVAWWKNAFAVANTILKIKVAEPGPTTPAAYLVTLSEKISEWISFNPHRADAELVEQRPLWEGQVLFTALLNGEPDQVANQHRISVAITADCVGRPLLRACRRIVVGIHPSGVEIQVIRRLQTERTEQP